MLRTSSSQRIATMRRAAFQNLMKNAGPLTDVSKLRYQAVFLMGAPGSGKGFVSKRLYLKYMPGGGSSGSLDPQMFNRELSEQERGLTNLNFEEVRDRIESYGFHIEINEGADSAKIPFRIYDDKEVLIPREDWSTRAPEIFEDIKELQDVVFAAPKYELPSYWRVVDPDMYKQELEGYMETKPGYVHEMSSEMSKAYFEAAVATGDPVIIDGTGAKASKYSEQMRIARDAGYSISLVWIYVPLVANIIRNCTRARVVHISHVTRLFKAMSVTWKALQGTVDKAKIISTFEEGSSGSDAKNYLSNKALVDGYVQEHTGYADLYTYMAESSDVPEDQKSLALHLKWLKGRSSMSPKELRMQELRNKFNR